MKEISDKSKIFGIWPLYGAAFCMALALNALWTAMPFVIRNIGGTEIHVGYVWAANMFSYMVCLFITGTKLGGHNPKNTTRISVAIIFTSILILCIIICTILLKNLYGNLLLIWAAIAACAVAGAAMALYWPYLMSWVSEDMEGHALNRRLGTFNGSWSGAAFIGPLLGGFLVDIGTPVPIVFVIVSIVICFIFLNIAADGSFVTSLFNDEQTRKVNGGLNNADIVRLRWIARIGLFSSWACLGVTRSQFALLFTEMGYSETWFGMLVMIFGICNFSIMTAAGRCVFWHFKSSFLLIAQAVVAVSLILVIFGRSLPIFVMAFVIMGCGFGFIYCSHLYYGTTGMKKRSTQMVIHEATLSLGIVIGSGTGGFIAKNFGSYSPYWFNLTLLTAGFIAQIILLPRKKITGEAK